jgi:hypothetical protein
MSAQREACGATRSGVGLSAHGAAGGGGARGARGARQRGATCGAGSPGPTAATVRALAQRARCSAHARARARALCGAAPRRSAALCGDAGTRLLAQGTAMMAAAAVGACAHDAAAAERSARRALCARGSASACSSSSSSSSTAARAHACSARVPSSRREERARVWACGAELARAPPSSEEMMGLRPREAEGRPTCFVIVPRVAAADAAEYAAAVRAGLASSQAGRARLLDAGGSALLAHASAASAPPPPPPSRAHATLPQPAAAHAARRRARLLYSNAVGGRACMCAPRGFSSASCTVGTPAPSPAAGSLAGFCACLHAPAFALQPYEIADVKRTAACAWMRERRRSAAAI